MWSQLTFGWVKPYLDVLRNPKLGFEDLIPLAPQDEPQYLAAQLAKVRVSRGSLLLALLSVHRRTLSYAMLASLVLCLGAVGIPLSLKWLLSVAEAQPGVLALLPPFLVLAVATLAQGAGVHHMFFQVMRVSQHVRAELPLLLFEKLHRLSLASQQRYPAGAVVNLVATDVNRIGWFFNMCFSLWLHPIQILVSLVLLVQFLGVAGIAGASVLCLSMFGNLLIARKQSLIKRQYLAVNDKRVAFLTELLGAIKLVKLYAWEEPSSRRLLALRDGEARLLWRGALWDGVGQIFFNGGSLLFSITALAVLLARGETLSIAALLPAITLLGTLRFALSNLPSAIQALFDAQVSLKRIEEFLDSSEYAPVGSTLPGEAAMEALEISANWPNGGVAVQRASLRVARGECVGIYGEVGSGKSALLLVLAGELPLAQGELRADETPVIVPQTPWIVSESIRNNIVLDQPFDQLRYHRILQATGLVVDIAQYPERDETMIGERGVNLSGGQRQRVALARAAYSSASVLLLDDPLSALDPAVAHQVFEQLIQIELRSRAVVLVTHRHEFLPHCSSVYRMHDGVLEQQEIPAVVAPVHFVHTTADTTIESLQKPGDDLILAEERRFGAVERRTVRLYLHRMLRATPIGVFLLAPFALREVAQIGADSWFTLWSQGVAFVQAHALLGFSILSLAAVVFLFLRFVPTLWAGLRVTSGYHEELLAAVMNAPLRFFHRNPVGRVVNRFSRDIASLDETVPRMLHDCIGCSSNVIAVTLFLLVLSPITLCAVVPAVWLYLRAQSLYRPASRECQRLDSVSRSPMLALCAEVAPGLIAQRRAEFFLGLRKRMVAAVRNNSRAFMNSTCCNRWIGLRLEALGVLWVTAAFVLLTQADSGMKIALGGLGLTLALSLTGTLNWAIRSFSMFEAGLASAERIEHYLAIIPEEEAPQADAGDVPPLWPVRGEVVFRNVELRYAPESAAVVSSLSLEISAGEKIGIIGRSGAGKSTILLGLFRAIEQSCGEILIDGIAIHQLPRRVLRLKLGYIPQEPTVLSGSVRSNLDPFGSYPDSELWRALEAVELAALVRAAPEGLEFPIREEGQNLSHGQRQLLCLARVLLKRPKVVVFDEATSSVDPETDQLVQRTIRREFRDATVITIAHRIETLRDYDRIVELSDGRVRRIGTPTEVLGPQS